MNDEIKKLYSALRGAGYTEEDLGNDSTFTSRMADKNARKQLYDGVSQNFDLGSYEDYEKRLSGGLNDASNPVKRVDVQQVQNAATPTLANHVDNQSDIMHYVANMLANTQPTDYFAEMKEEKDIDAQFTPSKVNSYADIMNNYYNRYALTQQGQKLQGELADTQRRISEKYGKQFLESREYKKLLKDSGYEKMNEEANTLYSDLYSDRINKDTEAKQQEYIREFLASDEYKALASQYSGDKLNAIANELFNQLYGDKLAADRKPYQEAYSKEFGSRPEYQELLSKYDIEGFNKKANDLYGQMYGKQIEKEMAPYNQAYTQLMQDRYGSFIDADIKQLQKSQNDSAIENLDKNIQEQKQARQERIDTRNKKRARTTSNNIVGAMYDASKRNLEETKEERQEAVNLAYAEKLLDQSKHLMTEAKNPSKYFFSGLYHGAKDSLSDLDKWSMGLMDMANASTAKKVIDKIEKNEKLTPSEMAIMDAMVTSAATEIMYQQNLGRGYKAGQVTGESLPFMLDMITGMGTIQAATKGTSKAMVKYAAKRLAESGVKPGTYAGNMLRNVTSFGVGLTKDMMNVAAHTATFGLPRVGANYMERANGQTDVNMDGEGRFTYNGQINQEVGLPAIAKSIITTAAETGTELLGDHFGAMLTGIGQTLGVKSFSSLMPKEIAAYVAKLKHTPEWKNIAEYSKAAHISSPIPEYAEEVINNLINYGTGDLSKEELVSLDQNIDTFLGVTPLSMILGTYGVGKATVDRYKSNQRIKKFEQKMDGQFGEDWTEVRHALQEADVKETREFVKEQLSRKDMSEQDKEDMLHYVFANMQQQALKGMNLEMDAEDIEANKHDIYNSYKRHRNYVLQYVPEKMADRIANMSDEEIAALRLNEQETNAILNYRAAAADFNQYMQHIENKEAAAREEAQAQVETLTNKTTGKVTRVQTNMSETPLHIMRGNVVFNSDGTVDKQNSDQIVYYRNEEGEVKMAPIRNIQNLVSDDDAAQLTKQMGDDAAATIEATEQEEIDPSIPFGTTWEEKGKVYSVNEGNADGYIVNVSDADGNPLPTRRMSGDEIKAALNSQSQDVASVATTENAPEMEAPQTDAPEVEAPQTGAVPAPQAQTQEEYAATLPHKKKNGRDVIDYDALTPRQLYEYTALDDPKEALDDLNATIDAKTQEIEKDKEAVAKAVGAKRAELRDALRVKEKDLAEWVSVRDQVAPKTTEEVQQSEVPQAVQTTQQVEEVAASSAPNTEDAKEPDFETLKPEETLAALNSNLDKDEVDAFIAAKKKDIQKDIDKLEKKAPKVGSSMTAYKTAKEQHAAQMEVLKTKMQYWNAIEKQQKEMNTPIGQSMADEVMSNEEPQNGHELAAQMLASGGIKLLHEDYKKQSGFGNREAQGMLGIFATAENGGVSVDKAAEHLMSYAKAEGYNFFDENDPTDAKNTILDVLSENRTKGELNSYIVRNRKAVAQREAEAAAAEHEAFIKDTFHVTPEEMDGYEQSIQEQIESEHPSEDEINEYMSEVADQIADFEDEQRIIKEGFGSNQVLSEASPFPTKGTTGTEERADQTDGGINSENGNTPEAEHVTEPIIADNAIRPNRMTGGDAVVKVIGSQVKDGKREYLVSFAATREDAEGGLFIGEKMVSEEELKQIIGQPRRRRGGFNSLQGGAAEGPSMSHEEQVQQLFEKEKARATRNQMSGEYGKVLAQANNLQEAIAHFRKYIDTAVAEYKDWASRKYKDNKDVVRVGDDEFSATYQSKGHINEARRQSRMRNALNFVAEVEGWIDTLMERSGIDPKSEEAKSLYQKGYWQEEAYGKPQNKEDDFRVTTQQEFMNEIQQNEHTEMSEGAKSKFKNFIERILSKDKGKSVNHSKYGWKEEVGHMKGAYKSEVDMFKEYGQLDTRYTTSYQVSFIDEKEGCEYFAYYEPPTSIGKQGNIIVKKVTLDNATDASRYSVKPNDSATDSIEDTNVEEETVRKAVQPQVASKSGLIRDRYTRHVKDAGLLDRLAKKLGVTIQFVDSVAGGKANAEINSSTILIEKNNPNPVKFLIGHEITHRVQDISPESYEDFKNAVKKIMGKGFDAEVARQKAMYKEAEVNISDEKITDEVTADFAGLLANNRETLEKFVPEVEPSILQQILDVLKQIKDMVMGTTPLDEAIGLIETALRDAAAQVVRLDPSLQNVTMKNNEIVASEHEKTGQAVYSLKTYEEEGRQKLNAFLQSKVADGALTKKEAADISGTMEDLYDLCKKEEGNYEPFSHWSKAEVVIDDNGYPVFSVIKSNGDYSMNLDFSLVCKKRRTLDAVFNEMIGRGLVSEFELGMVDIAKINDVIRRHGFETACRLCFVDSKRFRQAKVADDFCAIYNRLVNTLIPKDSGFKADFFNFGEAKVESVDKPLNTIPDAELNIEALESVLANETSDKTVVAKVAKHLLEHPSDRRLVQRADFMSTRGFDNVKTQNPTVLSLYNSKKGSGGPKSAFSDVQYLNDIIDSRWTPEAAYAVGGVRLQSFSDFVPRMVFDYMQMVADLAAKNLPVHAYTKEELFVKMFGLTGIKINMSLVPKVVKGGVAPGLDENGNYAWQENETFDFDEAVKIQNTEGYRENCGTIAVGISDAHIRKMLDDPNIRYVIPYHKSGINKQVAIHNNIAVFGDYTNYQNTRYQDGKKLTKTDMKHEPNFNELVRQTNDARKAAQLYLDWCKENNYLPKFAQFAFNEDGTMHQGYYKVLQDFTVLVPTEKGEQYYPQKGVRMHFPSEGAPFGSIAELLKRGLDEDAVLEGKRDAEVGNIVDEIDEIMTAEKAQKEAKAKEAKEKKAAQIKAMDDAYMAAVEAGDMKKAQKLVDDAAKKAKYVADENHEFAHKNVKNGTKSLDAVTYDNKGKVIPLSKRFNTRKKDVRYSLKSSYQTAAESTEARMQAIPEERRSKILEQLTALTEAYDQENRELLDKVSKALVDACADVFELVTANRYLLDVMDKPWCPYAFSIWESKHKDESLLSYDKNPDKWIDSLQKRIDKCNDVNDLEYYKLFVSERIPRGYKNLVRKPVNQIKKKCDERIKEILKGSNPTIKAEFKKTDLDSSGYSDLFHSLCENRVVAELFDKVMAVAETMPLKYNLRKIGKQTCGDYFADIIRINVNILNDPQKSNERKAETLLHELIHAVTVYAVEAVNNKRAADLIHITPEMKEAINALNDIYGTINADKSFEGMYGLTNAKEMLAELSNPMFRDKLHEKNLWKKIIDAFKKFFGIEADEQNNALDAVSGILDYMLDNFDTDAYNEYLHIARQSNTYLTVSKHEAGTLAEGGSYFSGGGLLEEGLKQVLKPKFAVEYDKRIAGVYRNNFGDHIVTADVRDVDPTDLAKRVNGRVQYFHASPVCKNFSTAKQNAEELPLDKVTAEATAKAIREMRPEVVTIENVAGYKKSESLGIITDVLDELGYTWDNDVYNAADYGAATSRSRMILRAVREGLTLPPKPAHTERSKGWMSVTEDLIDDLPETNVPQWMRDRLANANIDVNNLEKPLYVLGTGSPSGGLRMAYADELMPTLTTTGGDRIFMPDGRVLAASGRVLARISGMSDDYTLPESDAAAHKIIGNGIPVKLTEAVIAPLIESRIIHAKEVRKITEEIDKEYLKAARANDIPKATELFRKYVYEQADDNIVPIDYAVSYRAKKNSEIAKGLKAGDKEAIREAVYQMRLRVPEGSVLIPMPSSSGKAEEGTMKLVESLAKATNSEVKDILRGFTRESIYNAKKKGHKLTSEMLGIHATEELPKDKNVIIIDNVIDLGTTAAAAARAVKGATVLGYAYTGSKERTANLKLADPITHDDMGKVIPLSERFNPNKDDVRYSLKGDHKSLIGVHNISEDKLRKALKMGGFANPSMAVIDSDTQNHDDYGAISLIAPSALVDAKSGKNVGTYTADAWTPTYPQIMRKMTNKGYMKFQEMLKGLDDPEMKSKIKLDWDNYLENEYSIDGLKYWFLKETGRDPQKVYEKSEYADELKQFVTENRKQKEDSFEMTSFDEFTDEQRKEFLRLLEQNDKGKYETLTRRMKPKEDSSERVKAVAAQRNNDVDTYGAYVSGANNVMGEIARAARTDGRLDEYATTLQAAQTIREEGLDKEFDEWLDNKFEETEAEEVWFDGYTPSGNRKYIKNTLENVSRWMKKQGRNAATGVAGFNRFVATLSTPKKSLSAIRKVSDNLKSEKDYQQFREEWSQTYKELSEAIKAIGTYSFDSGERRLEEVAKMSDPREYLKNEYGVEVSDWWLEDFKALKKAIVEEFPARYFETKFERPVHLNEFVAAVVPENIDPDLRGILSQSGLKVYDYKPEDKESRHAAMQQAIQPDGVRFSLKAEQNKVIGDVSKQGLRKVLGEDKVDDLMDDVFAKVDEKTRRRIAEMSYDYDFDIRKATEDYMAYMAEEAPNAELIKHLKGMLKPYVPYDFSDNEIRYLLWRNAQNLNMSRPIDVAHDVAMQYSLGVGNYSKGVSPSRYSLKGEKGMRRLDKYNGNKEYMDNLKVAKQMERANKDAKSIKAATGWERGADGKWRYETKDLEVKYGRKEFVNYAIDDEYMADVYDRYLNNEYLDEWEEEEMKYEAKNITERLQYHHTILPLEDVIEDDELFVAYPELKKYKVIFGYKPELSYYGYCSAKKKEIFLNVKPKNQLPSTLRHEIQHAIQSIEGFAIGANTETVRDEIRKRYRNYEANWELHIINQEKKRDLDEAIVKLEKAKQWIKNPNSFKKSSEYFEDTPYDIKEAALRKASNYIDQVASSPFKYELEQDVASALLDVWSILENNEKAESFLKQSDEFINGLKQVRKDIIKKLSETEEDYKFHDRIGSALEKDNYELYRATSGEVEARNVEKRMDMTLEQRRNSLASETEDVPRDEQLFLYDNSRYSLKTDELERLNNEPTTKSYRAMQIIDGKLYPPMATKVDGSLVKPIRLGEWEKAVERPDLAEPSKDKDGNIIYNFKLNKGGKNAVGKPTGSVPARYNPYWHSSRSPLNDQFKSAWVRPNLVTVEVEIPESELTSGYKAEKAKDAVGEVEWKSGVVSGKLAALGKPRKVILSRYDKPVRIVPEREVAAKIKEMIGDADIAIPINTITPKLRAELEKVGVKIGEPEKGMKLTDDVRNSFAESENFDSTLSRYSIKADPAETERIIAEAKKNGSYMTAPNGKRSNLNEKQWAQVRTTAFKKWFGDWELPLKSVHIVHAYANHGFSSFAQAKEWAAKNIVRTYNDEETGHKGIVKISNSAIGKYLSESAIQKSEDKDVHMSVLKVLPQVIKESVDAERHADYLKKDGERRLENGINENVFIHRLYGAVEIADKLYRVKVTLKEYRDENQPNVPHSYEAIKIEPSAGTLVDARSTDPNTNSSISAANLLKGVEKSYESGKYLLDSSKVVDENGEPLVVYHGSRLSGFSVFDDKEGFKESDAPEGSSWFTNDKDNAKSYSGTYDDATFENPDESYAGIYACYLNIRNPYMADFEGKEWTGDEGDGRSTNDMTEEAMKRGNDGCILKNVIDSGIYGEETADDYVVFNSTQIKSATDNNGNFDPTDPDIRYSLKRPNLDIDHDKTREEYEDALSTKAYKAQEAFQDSMLALKKVQEIVAKSSNSKIEDFENAYQKENQLSSKNHDESRAYKRNYFEPLIAAVEKLMDKYEDYDKVSDYVLAKHGLERNEKFAIRDAENDAREMFRDAYAALDKKLNKGEITQQQYDQKKDDLDQKHDAKRDELLKDNLLRDYSGLIQLTGMTDQFKDLRKKKRDSEISDTDYMNELVKLMDEVKQETEDIVRSFESTHNKTNVDNLWKKVNAATKATLEKAYRSGMVSKDVYEHTRDMFDFYVPLRGWNDTTADEVYDYLTQRQGGAANSTVKKAKGRESKADDPFATIGFMAEGAIMQGNRNLMKQAFMNLALNHKTDLLTLRPVWYVYNDLTDEWNISYPAIKETDDMIAIDDKIKAHDDKMKLLKAVGKATRMKPRARLNYVVLKNQESEHVVIVRNNGKEYYIVVNGNPRAAQAVNGLTNPSIESNPFLNALASVNRWMAANFTSRNPEFVLSNLSRDFIFANTAVFIKEDADYGKKFRHNITRVAPVVFRGIRGKSDMSKEADQYFKEFTENGGETGYMHITDVDSYKRKIEKELKTLKGQRGWARNRIDFLTDRLEEFNRAAEDISRFAVYMTSRQMGKSIQDSVNDAKEITVNFNKKGAGFKTMGKNSGTFGNLMGMLAGTSRTAYLFFNPAVQALANAYRLNKTSRAKFGAAVGSWVAMGMLLPFVNMLMGGGDDDDEGKYENLPSWIRRNNICIRIPGTDEYVTIPLPIELRAFYGLGEMALMYGSGKEEASPLKISYDMANQFTELLPLNPLGHEGNIIKTLTPSYFGPLADAYVFNEDFTGKPIYNENKDKRYPEWQKAYNGTSGWLVGSAKFLNDLTNGKPEGSDFRKGGIDLNPARIEYLTESYLGGRLTFVNRLGKTIWYGGKAALGMDDNGDFVQRNIPFVNRFFSHNDERSGESITNQNYYRLKDEMEQFEFELRNVNSRKEREYDKYGWQYSALMESDDYERFKVFEAYRNLLDNLYKRGLYLEGEEAKENDKRIVQLRSQLLLEMSDLNGIIKERTELRKP